MRNIRSLGLVVAAFAAYLLYRQGKRWGATEDEVDRSLPGDDLVPHPMVEIKGHRMGGTAEVINEEKAAIATSLLACMRKHPSLAKGYHVPLDADGQPNPEAVQQVAHFLVMVPIHLSEGPAALPPTR